MVKYIITSTGALSEVLPKLGNAVEIERRSSEAISGYHPDRFKGMLCLQQQHKIVSNGDRGLFR